MSDQFNLLQVAILEELRFLGWLSLRAWPSFAELAMACGRFYESQLVEYRSHPDCRLSQRYMVFAGIGVIACGDPAPVVPILDFLIQYPEFQQTREGVIAREIKRLFPFPATIDPLKQPVAAKIWISENLHKLKWDKDSGRYALGE